MVGSSRLVFKLLCEKLKSLNFNFKKRLIYLFQIFSHDFFPHLINPFEYHDINPYNDSAPNKERRA